MSGARPQRGPRGQRGPLRLLEAPSPEIAGRLPPHNLDAEASVLSACMLSPIAVDLVLDVLVPEHFYSDANGKIFEAIRTIAVAGNPVDIVSVAEILRGQEQLAQIGGSPYLAQLSDATPAVAHVRSHAQIVAELSYRRVMIATLHKCLAHGYGELGMSDPLYNDRVAAAVQKAATAGSRSQATPLGDAMKTAMNTVQQQSTVQGSVVGLPTGYPAIDALTGGLHKRELTFLGAPRKTGKSSLARGMAVNIARTPRLVDLVTTAPSGESLTSQTFMPQGVAIFTLEMEDEEIALDMACTQGQVDNLKLKNKTASPADYTNLFTAAQWLSELPIRLVGNRRITAIQIRGQLRAIQAEFASRGIQLALVIVDTIQLLVANEEKGEQETDEAVVDRVGRALGQISVDFDVPVLALTQLNATGEARGSRALEMHAQNFWKLVVHKNKPAQGWPPDLTSTPVEASLKMAFQRHGPQDEEAPLWFIPAFTLFQDGSP